MSAIYYAIPTNAGQARIANALALGIPLKITHMAVGDGNGQPVTPNPAQTALVKEKRRAPLNTLFQDPLNQSQLVAEQIIPEDVGNWWIREVGLYDDSGTLIALANCPDTYKPLLSSGSGRTQVIRMVLIVSDTSAVELKIDPSVVLATRKYVDDAMNAQALALTNRADLLHVEARESLRRSYADAGYNLVEGSFETGGKLYTITDVLLHEAVGKAYSWGGSLTKTVLANATPESSGGLGTLLWTDRSVQTARKKVVILATGQSNVQQEPAYDWTPPSNIFVWAWPGLGATGAKFIPCHTTKVNHTYVCAAELARLNPTWDVYIIKIASSGRPIAHWLPGGSATTAPTWDAYADCKNNVEAALAILGVSAIDYLHWHQGESDITDLGPYTTKWDSVFTRFCGETWFKRNTRVLVNGVTSQQIKGDSNYTVMNQKLRSIVRASPTLRTLVPTAELVPLDLWQADGLHMSGEGHYFLGVAAARAMQFGSALPLPQGYQYEPESKAICLGGASPSAGGTVEVNRGSQPNGESWNMKTSFDVINTNTGPLDYAQSRVIGANGIFKVTTTAQGALANTVVLEWTGTSQMLHKTAATGYYSFHAGSTEIVRMVPTVMQPGTDNNVRLGQGGLSFKDLYVVNSPIVTSDARMKTVPEAITDDVLDAWAEVDFYTYKMLASVEREGAAARIHTGVIAQRIIEAFAAKNLDATQYGLLCHDSWESSPAEYQLVPAEYDADGNLLSEERTILVSPERAAGDRYSIRYEEALVLEAAYQRRRCDRLEARLTAAGL